MGLVNHIVYVYLSEEGRKDCKNAMHLGLWNSSIGTTSWFNHKDNIGINLGNLVVKRSANIIGKACCVASKVDLALAFSILSGLFHLRNLIIYPTML